MTDEKLDLSGGTIGVARTDDNITIFIPGYFFLTIDEATAIELAVAIYAKANRRFDSPPMH